MKSKNQNELALKKNAKKALVKERTNVQSLLAKNPNYFGNLAQSKFKAVLPVAFNTFYEELTCVGYNPEFNELFATFIVKRPTGYGGPLCTKGTNECIRFFIDYGSGWIDEGIVAVNVHDIPTKKDCHKDPEKPLCFSASLKLKELKRKICNSPVLPKLRAILSWFQCPPEGKPNFKPVWGNRMDCTIQIKPVFWGIPSAEVDDFLPDFLEKANCSPSLTVSQILELTNEGKDKLTSLANYQPKSLDLSQLATLYKGKNKFKVPPLRFGLESVKMALENADEVDFIPELIKSVPGLKLDSLLQEYKKTKANTSYEELVCLGQDYNREWLTATVKVKQAFGYSGTLCYKGSFEYVRFWADWDDNCQWTDLGVTSVNVHDLQKIGKDGVCYTVVLPLNLDKYKEFCKRPKVVRIRAVLSWNSIPPLDPDQLNTYGNRLDTHIQLKPKTKDYGLEPIFTIIGGIPVDQIDNTSGLTAAGAKFALTGIAPDNLNRPCPFGGRVVLQGPLFPGYKYRVQVRRDGETVWTDVVKSLVLTGYNFSPPSVIYTSLDADPVTHYFDYLPDNKNINNILAWWDTSGNDKWEVKLDILGIPGSFIQVIQLNHQTPEATISIDGAGGTGAGDCKDYLPKSKLKGHFVARSNYLKRYSLGTSVPSAAMIPSSGSTNTAVSPGNNWMMTIPAATKKCGYYVRVSVVDRTIINSSYVGFWKHEQVGFCVR